MSIPPEQVKRQHYGMLNTPKSAMEEAIRSAGNVIDARRRFRDDVRWLDPMDWSD